MFTGIIETVARVKTVTSENDGALRMTVITPWTDLSLGESIAVNGVCLTAAEIANSAPDQSEVLFFLSAETLSRSNLSKIRAGSRVNLERALRADTRLSGHIVQGHVDGLARLSRVEKSGDTYLIEFDLPQTLLRYCVEKGSIALNGVSLTINRLNPFSITLIPHTWEHTNFSEYQPGDALNVEVDVLAKYVEKLCQPYLPRLSS